MTEDTIVQRLVRHAEEHPDRHAFTFLRDGAEREVVTYADLNSRALRVAAELRAATRRRGPVRALLLLPQSAWVVEALFGCFHAGVCAVPGHVPLGAQLPKTLPRLRAIAVDARPQVVLTTRDLMATRGLVPELASARWIAIDELAGTASRADGEVSTADDLAILQYSSGSTGAPRGVMVSHKNLMHSELLIQEAFEHTQSSVVVGWLPFQHDMGLIGNVLQPVYVGAECVLMTPMAFLKRPLRWLHAITEHRATTSGAPNFAYEMCVDEAQRRGCEGLDLSEWSLAFVGAEPVRAGTLDRFERTFAPYGFRREAFYPCYGLAEATLMVTGGLRADAPRTRRIPRSGAGGETVRVGCGGVRALHDIAIVEADSSRRVGHGEEGEIWVRGPSVATGYFEKPDASQATFGARILGEEGAWLRTGDLGCLLEGELYVTGRLKDVVVVKGAKYAAEDIEHDVGVLQGAPLRAGACAVFSHDDGERERLVVVQEVDPDASASWSELAERIAAAVVERSAPADVVSLVRKGSIPRTTSGKVRRAACRQLFAAGELREVHRHVSPRSSP